MEPGSRYFKQVELLVQLLPVVAKYKCFALKGGTAINLFVRDLPRLSVDIDVTYVPVKARDTALAEIDSAFRALKIELERRLPGLNVAGTVLGNTEYFYKLVAQMVTTQVKIEVSPVMRGVVESPVQMETSQRTQETFGYASTPVVAFNDLYAGKLCAALSRQHPRDLFDVSILLRTEGITDDLLEVFLIYLVCGNRPISEMLAPTEKGVRQAFMKEFKGMTSDAVRPELLLETRSRLITEINEKLSDRQRQFLLSVKRGEPDWRLMNKSEVKHLPAIQWKLHNIRKMPKQKHKAALAKLERVLYG